MVATIGVSLVVNCNVNLYEPVITGYKRAFHINFLYPAF